MLKIKFENEDGPPLQRHVCSELYFDTVIVLTDSEAASLAKGILEHRAGTDEELLIDFVRRRWKLTTDS